MTKRTTTTTGAVGLVKRETSLLRLLLIRILGNKGYFLRQVSPFVGAGSDHASFLFYAGVPVMDIMFVEVAAS